MEILVILNSYYALIKLDNTPVPLIVQQHKLYKDMTIKIMAFKYVEFYRAPEVFKYIFR